MFPFFVIALTVIVLSVANAATYTTGTFLVTAYTSNLCTETSVENVKGTVVRYYSDDSTIFLFF